jgi:hypothetical protein
VLGPYGLLTTSDADLVQARPLGKPSHWFLFVGERGLEGDDVEVGDHLEVAHVKRDHIEAEMEGCGSDDEIWKVNADPLAHLLAVDTPGQLRDSQRERMHSHRLEEFFDEGFRAFAVGVCPGSIDTVRQFYGSHSRAAVVFPRTASTRSRISHTLSLRLSPAIRMLESRITPMRADSTVCGS